MVLTAAGFPLGLSALNAGLREILAPALEEVEGLTSYSLRRVTDGVAQRRCCEPAELSAMGGWSRALRVERRPQEGDSCPIRYAGDKDRSASHSRLVHMLSLGQVADQDGLEVVEWDDLRRIFANMNVRLLSEQADLMFEAERIESETPQEWRLGIPMPRRLRAKKTIKAAGSVAAPAATALVPLRPEPALPDPFRSVLGSMMECGP